MPDASQDRPFEWWERTQVELLIGFTREHAPELLPEVERFREHPEEWRAFRERLGAAKEAA